ncbi:MAG: PAS domain S-box protein [Candidatus Aminicenantes bacterium]|nr:PAS domain S-box protein [Candidatus Aminicenantes bacterium]
MKSTPFYTLFSNSIAVMLLIDPESHRIVDVNPAAEKFYGWDHEVFVQKRIDQINTLSREEIDNEMRKAQDRVCSHFRFQHRKSNGEVCPVEIISSKVELNGKEYLHSIVYDISEVVQVEAKLQEKHRLLQDLTSQVPGVVYQYRLYPDGHSAFPYSSSGIWDIYEVTPEQVREDASLVFTRIHPDDLDYISDSISKSAENLTTYHSEFRVMLPQQGLQWRKCDARPERLEDGSTLWHGIIIDISEQKRADLELRHSHELMQYIIEHNQSAVAVHDREMNYIYVSKRYLNDYRVQEKNIIGRNHYDVFPDLPQKWRDAHQRALQGEVVSANFDYYFRYDGEKFWTRWECRPWYQTDGSIGGVIVYTEVINEQIKREQEIKLLNERLEILIDALKELSSAQTVDAVQEIVVNSARNLTRSDGATMVLLESDFCHYVAENAIAPLWKGSRFPIDQCISGWAMAHKQPAVIKDIYADARIPVDAYKQTFVKSLVLVPVYLNRTIGAIGNYWGESYKATRMEIALLQTLADATAQVLENIQLRLGLELKIREKTAELQKRLAELERFHDATIEREFRIKELREEIDRLKSREGNS